MYNPFSLEGKTILVTGASSGIGRSIAVECSRLGARIFITARNKSRLQETLSQMEGQGHQYICSDLNDEASIISLVEQLPQLNGVVHNAGIGDRTMCKMVSAATIKKVMTTNFEGPALLQRHLLKKKKIEREGSIVFISSRAPFAPSLGNAFYAASKGAIIGYAKCLGLEVAPQKVRVNCICPAMVWTEMAEKDAALVGADYSVEQKKYALGRYGKPEDIAYLAIYLLSNASCWMTGSCVDITGGGEFTLV